MCVCVCVCVLLQAAFAFSLVWSVGGSCDTGGRTHFDYFLREILSGNSKEDPLPSALAKWECPFDEKGLVYDYSYEVCLTCINSLSLFPFADCRDFGCNVSLQ